MRALLLVLDGMGCGAAPDAHAYGDDGANTLGRIFSLVPTLDLPTLFSLGLRRILTGRNSPGRRNHQLASHGRMQPLSPGKNSITGHWEMAGVILKQPFATFNRLPRPFLAELESETGTRFLGNQSLASARVLKKLGEAHLRTGRPILSILPDSAIQIAAHEQVLPRHSLDQLCRETRRLANRWRVARVVARPLTGPPDALRPSKDTHDFGMVPPPTVLNALADAGHRVESVGKIHALFSGSGITHSHPSSSNAEAMNLIERLWTRNEDCLIFANLSEFDSPQTHLRDPARCAAVLREFDAWLGDFLRRVEVDDLLILTADHGNDPGFPGSNHTREEVPLIVLHDGAPSPLGTRTTFADVARTLAEFFQLESGWHCGTSFLPRPS